MFTNTFDHPDCPHETIVECCRHLLKENLRMEREVVELMIQRDMSFQQWKMIAAEFQLQGLKYERLWIDPQKEQK